MGRGAALTLNVITSLSHSHECRLYSFVGKVYTVCTCIVVVDVQVCGLVVDVRPLPCVNQRICTTFDSRFMEVTLYKRSFHMHPATLVIMHQDNGHPNEYHGLCKYHLTRVCRFMLISQIHDWGY